MKAHDKSFAYDYMYIKKKLSQKIINKMGGGDPKKLDIK